MVKIKYLMLSLIALLSASTVYGVPAKPGVIKKTLPNGEVISLNLQGDESHHQYFSLDGYPVMESADGYFYYGTLSAQGRIESSDIRVNNIESRDSHEKAFVSALDRELLVSSLNQDIKRNARAKYAPQPQRSDYPTIGEQHALVVLVEYTDCKFSVNNPQQAFYDMMNEENYNHDGATGSARQYFENASDGKFKPTFDVIGPITLGHDVSYYGGNTQYGDARPEEMAIEACQLIDDTVDFNLYDNNKDGFIDNVYVFYAGLGEASGGNSNTVWPHSWDIYDVLGKRFEFDGLVLNHYACSNEIYNGKIEGIGTFCHEFSHVLGLVDEYSTNYTSSFVPGNYSTLCYGCYNNDSKTPAGYTLYQKYALGWTIPIEIGEPAQHELLPLVTSNTGYILRTSNPNEYFLLENRQLESWDAYIPGHGMLIWHIDYDEGVWYYNQPNDNPSHQHIDIEEADNIQTEDTRDGDIFPGTAGITSFTDETRPSSISWDRELMNKPITDIREIDGVIYFQISGGVPMNIVENVEVSEVTPVSAKVEWGRIDVAEGYRISVSEIAGEEKVIVEAYNDLDLGDVNTVVLSGLKPETQYGVQIKAYNKFQETDYSELSVFTTQEATFDMLSPVATAATEVTMSSFVANWNALEGASNYYLSVYEKGRGEAEKSVADFTDGIKSLPEGYFTNTSATYASEAYSGQAVPSLRMSNDRTYIETPKFDSDVRTLSFWHRGTAKSDGSQIVIYAFVDNKWVEYDRIDIVTEEGGYIYEIADGALFAKLQDECHAIKLEFVKMNSGSLAIDDIIVGYGGSVIPNYLQGFENLNVEASLSKKVDNLNPNTYYYYVVYASNGEINSAISNEIFVKTDEDNAVERVNEDNRIVATSENGVIKIHSAYGYTEGCLYDVNGMIVSMFSVADGRANIAVPSSGLYILRIGDNVLKIFVK